MSNENTSHVELIVKDGTVTIPSIFMFEYPDDVTHFIRQAQNMNCTVIFENESLVIKPEDNYTEYRYYLFAYNSIISNRKIGDAYVRYVGSPDKMSWDKVGK